MFPAFFLFLHCQHCLKHSAFAEEAASGRRRVATPPGIRKQPSSHGLFSLRLLRACPALGFGESRFARELCRQQRFLFLAEGERLS